MMCSLHIGTEVEFTGRAASIINIDDMVEAVSLGSAVPLEALELEPTCEEISKR